MKRPAAAHVVVCLAPLTGVVMDSATKFLITAAVVLLFLQVLALWFIVFSLIGIGSAVRRRRRDD